MLTAKSSKVTVYGQVAVNMTGDSQRCSLLKNFCGGNSSSKECLKLHLIKTL